MGFGRVFAGAMLAFGVAGAAMAQQAPAPLPVKEYVQQFLVPGSWFHGVHGIAFNKDDQLFAGSVIGQTVYRVQVDTGEVDPMIEPPAGMADDIAFAEDGTMAWTAFLLGKVYVRRGTKTVEVTGLSGPNALAFGKDGRLFVSEVFLGDALYEVDLRNFDKPEFKQVQKADLRKIADKLGGLNGFEINKDDGFLYGPLWFKGQAVKVNVDTGLVEVVASGFVTPAAVNIDPQVRDNLYVVDTGNGSVWSVSLTSKAKRLVASLKPGLDNLAFDSRGRLFVTSMTDNGIYLVDKRTGSARTIVEGRLAVPSDLAVVSDAGGKETVHIADVFSYRTVDGGSGAVSDVLRVHGETHNYPTGISVGPKNVLLSSWFSNTVEKVDRKTGKLAATLGDFTAPVDALESADGTVYVAELGTGNLVKVSPDGKQRSVIAKDLRAPVAMAQGAGNVIYVTEYGAGAVTALDLGTGARRVVVDGLAGPEGIDVGPDGKLYVAEVGQRRILTVDPASGARTVIASNLDIGLEAYPGGPPALVTTGVAVAKSGTVYVSSDRRNALYKLTPPAH
jgi:sugar lactone lactonase YvrE